MTVHGFSHAGYYPGAHPITLKAVYDADSLRLLGAQACGGSEGVDKRLDVIATAIAGETPPIARISHRHNILLFAGGAKVIITDFYFAHVIGWTSCAPLPHFCRPQTSCI